MNQEQIEPKSQKSWLPHVDGQGYTKFFSPVYDYLTSLTGWRAKIRRYALDQLPEGRLLDVGCGTGYAVSLAKSEGREVLGIDASQGMLAKGRLRYGLSEEELFFASAEELPFEDSSFDVALACGSLVHVPQIEKALSEMLRVVRPGGRIRIIDHLQPQKKNWNTSFFTLFSHLSGDILHDYVHYIGSRAHFLGSKVIGRGGYMQRLDFTVI